MAVTLASLIRKLLCFLTQIAALPIHAPCAFSLLYTTQSLGTHFHELWLNGIFSEVFVGVRVIKTNFNAGFVPQFTGEFYGIGLRRMVYRQDHWVPRFPLLWSDERLSDALEMNLFLEHRYKGSYMSANKKGRGSALGGVTVKTLYSVANSLARFLMWLTETNADWKNVTAQAKTERAKYWLPVYQFRKYLIDEVTTKSIDRNTANLYMGHVRQFYEWARTRGVVKKLPFSYSYKNIKPQSAEQDINSLFSFAPNNRGVVVQTNDLSIPKKYRQKKLPHDVLTPFTKYELELFFKSNYMVYPTRKLWAELAMLAGLRAFEVAALPEHAVQDPSVTNQSAFYVKIFGKFDKERTVLIPRTLMVRLWLHLNSPERLDRAMRWDLKHGAGSDRPLFLNRSGLQVSEKSISNLTNFVKVQLKKEGKIFNRRFHDFRSTYATNIAKYMLDQNLPAGFIEFKLMSLLGHSNFSTTRHYLNFARSITFDSEMKGWTDTVFDGIEDRLIQDYQYLVGESNDK